MNKHNDKQPAFVLVNPQMGENIGAAARAMLNFGLTDLRLVAPRDGWPNPRAVETSSGALDQMPPVSVFETLAAALADCHFVYATTARGRDADKKMHTANAACFDARSRTGQKIAFVFGPERTGLTNDDLSLCHDIVTVPTNPDFSSLNLGQGVLLLAYEWVQSAAYDPEEKPDTRVVASHDELNNLFIRLERVLEEHNFFRVPGVSDNVRRSIRTMFLRAELSDQEISTFHGVISALIGNKKV